MKVRRTLVLIVSVCCIVMLFGSLKAQNDTVDEIEGVKAEGFRFLRDFFDYDDGIPLDARVVDRSDESTYIREKIVLRGIRDSRIPGYLAIPDNGGESHPCVILIHGIGGSKADWWREDSFHSGAAVTKALLSSGFAVLTVDAVYHGERLADNNFESPEVFLFQKGWTYRARDMVVDSVVEHRRAIDFLVSRKEIDASRIGVIGYSMGGMMAFQLAAVDSRIKATVACVTPLFKDEDSAMTVHNFAPHIQDTPFLMLIGKDDSRNYSVDDARDLFDRINSGKKDLVVFDSGHQLPTEWTDRATGWMNNHLE